MTLDPDTAAGIADRLFEAERDLVQIGLVSRSRPGLTMADAYAIQQRLVDRKIASGRTATGWKIGLTSRAMQNALNIDIPDSGVLFDDMHFESGAIVPRGSVHSAADRGRNRLRHGTRT